MCIQFLHLFSPPLLSLSFTFLFLSCSCSSFSFFVFLFLFLGLLFLLFFFHPKVILDGDVSVIETLSKVCVNHHSELAATLIKIFCHHQRVLQIIIDCLDRSIKKEGQWAWMVASFFPYWSCIATSFPVVELGAYPCSPEIPLSQSMLVFTLSSQCV